MHVLLQRARTSLIVGLAKVPRRLARQLDLLSDLFRQCLQHVRVVEFDIAEAVKGIALLLPGARFRP